MVGHFGVRALITDEELRRLSGKPLFVGRGGIDVRLLFGGPVVQRHELAIGGAVLRRDGGTGLAQPGRCNGAARPRHTAPETNCRILKP